ncbi:MAG TPA: lytic murein transglycosylase [Vicinamibacterales bacterium]
MRFLVPFVVLLGTAVIAQSPSPDAPASVPSQGAQTPTPQTTTPVENTPVPAAAPAVTAPSFAEWLDGVRAEAVQRGIRQEVVDAAFADATEPLQVVIERDRTQAEKVLSLEDYIRRHLTATLVKRGRDAYGRYQPLLQQVSEKYGVPARIIAGIWGVESNFGGFSGVRPTIRALTTLAWDPRRAEFFRAELFDALEILNRGDIDLSRLKGSWAGAMGQPQFMPSSYLEYAEDFDGDGRRDIWTSPADIFASIANYLRGHGWVAGSNWGREVKIPKDVADHLEATLDKRTGGCSATRNMTVPLPLSEWRKLGLRSLDGTPLPASDQKASLFSGTTRHFLAYSNYDALLEYNCSNSYALSVITLGERISRPPTTKGVLD